MRLNGPGNLHTLMQIHADLTYAVQVIEAAQRVVEAAETIAQTRMEPVSSWGMIQDLHDELTTWHRVCGGEG